MIDSECAPNKACQNEKCVDPCTVQSCGKNARCTVVNHKGVCSCLSGFSGDAFFACYEDSKNFFPYLIGLNNFFFNKPEKKKLVSQTSLSYFYTVLKIQLYCLAPDSRDPVNPCVPSPCGPNSQCREVNGSPVCSCLPGMKGFSPNCRPECTRNDDCLNHLSCINQKCVDPCNSSPCGTNTECRVDKHNVICTCFLGYQSQDPTQGCSPIPITCKNISSLGISWLHVLFACSYWIQYSSYVSYSSWKSVRSQSLRTECRLPRK